MLRCLATAPCMVCGIVDVTQSIVDSRNGEVWLYLESVLGGTSAKLGRAQCGVVEGPEPHDAPGLAERSSQSDRLCVARYLSPKLAHEDGPDVGSFASKSLQELQQHGTLPRKQTSVSGQASRNRPVLQSHRVSKSRRTRLLACTVAARGKLRATLRAEMPGSIGAGSGVVWQRGGRSDQFSHF